MKKIILMIAKSLIVFGLSAQITETVSTGAGYVNDVYYSLENDEVVSVERENWDIAFGVGNFGATILTNEGAGIELYNYPNGDTSHWSTMDTVGLSGWKKYYNSDSLWSKGAFSQTSKAYPIFNTYDIGWGIYDLNSHVVTGDSLFVLKLSDGSFEKLWIQRYQSGHYYFKFADLYGSNEISDTLAKADYQNKNFAYYSLKTGTELDREPDNSSWDLLFTKYITMFNFGGSQIPYSVTGVLSNEDVLVNEVSGVATESADTLSTSFSGSISTIGYDWKSFSYINYDYVVSDSLTYFVKAKDGNVWKVNFTGFGGSANGDYHFTKQKINCKEIVTQDTTVYFVNDVKFSSISPKLLSDSTVTRKSLEGCDSVVNYYSNFIYSATYFSDTTVTSINDTITTVLYQIDTIVYNTYDTMNVVVNDTIVHNTYDTTTTVLYHIDTTHITVLDTNYINVNNYIDVYDTTTTVLYHIDTTEITVTDTNYINVNNYVNVYDSLIVDLTGLVTYVNTPFNNTLQVKVYPNPASEVLILEVLDAEVTASYTYELININGQTVEANGSLSSNTNTIDISSYTGGTYYVKFYDAQQKMVNQAPVVIRK